MIGVMSSMRVGIQAVNVYGGRTFLDVAMMAQARGLDTLRFANLLMRRKTVAANWEDPVSYAVNAAKPLIDQLSPAERDRIDLCIVATESGIDFGKSMSTYVHHHLGLSRNCRSFEVKQACYGGTAALQTAIGHILSGASRGNLALVVMTDVARPIPHSYAEPSQGAAAVALLVGDDPAVLEIEVGASGMYSYEVMDSCRPTSEIETGDPDLSLLSYLDCIENSFLDYQRKVPTADFQDHFDFLACHTPFGGMVKGAHRTMMRKLKRLPPTEIEADFQRRVLPSLSLCQQVGNVYSGTIFLALTGLILAGRFDRRKRIGLFSYGSGCCSEFYSGLADDRSQRTVAALDIEARMNDRYALSMPEYEALVDLNRGNGFGAETLQVDRAPMRHVYADQFEGRGLLVLDRIEGYHREYRWS